MTITAITNIGYLVISRKAFEDFRRQNPETAAKFLTALAREIGRIARATAPQVKALLALNRGG